MRGRRAGMRVPVGAGWRAGGRWHQVQILLHWGAGQPLAVCYPAKHQHGALSPAVMVLCLQKQQHGNNKAIFSAEPGNL